MLLAEVSARIRSSRFLAGSSAVAAASLEEHLRCFVTGNQDSDGSYRLAWEGFRAALESLVCVSMVDMRALFESLRGRGEAEAAVVAAAVPVTQIVRWVFQSTSGCPGARAPGSAAASTPAAAQLPSKGTGNAPLLPPPPAGRPRSLLHGENNMTAAATGVAAVTTTRSAKPWNIDEDEWWSDPEVCAPPPPQRAVATPSNIWARSPPQPPPQPSLRLSPSAGGTTREHVRLRQLARKLRVKAFSHLSSCSLTRRCVSGSPDSGHLTACCAALFGRFCGDGTVDWIDARTLARALRPFGTFSGRQAGSEADEGLKLSVVLRAMRGSPESCHGVTRDEFIGFVQVYGSGSSGSSGGGRVDVEGARATPPSARRTTNSTCGDAAASAASVATEAAAASVAFVPCSAATLRRRVDSGANHWKVPQQTSEMRLRVSKQMRLLSRKAGVDYRTLFRRSFLPFTVATGGTVAAARTEAAVATPAVEAAAGNDGCGDNGGVLGYAAFAAAMRALFGGSDVLRAAELDVLLAGVDVSGRGYIDVDAFVDFLRDV